MSEKSTWAVLSAIDVNGKTEKKNGLTYLSWSFAWAEVKKLYPDATYEIKRFDNNLPYVYDENTGYMVFTSVSINGITHEMMLPVMDGYNRAMKSHPYEIKTRKGVQHIEAATMFDINKTFMRCLTKNLAMHGLGMYIYAGEDLPVLQPIPTLDEYKQEMKAATDLTSLQDIFRAAWTTLSGSDKDEVQKFYENKKADFMAESEAA